MSTEDIEARAKEMGWAPKEEFRGDPEKWIDAETFVKRGEEMMPILRANNKRMSEELAQVREELKETKDLLKASADSIEALKEFNTQVVRKEAKKQQEELKEALVEARREGDVDKELEITDQLQQHTAALKEAEKVPPKPAPRTPEELDPTQAKDWKDWVSDNTWFGQDKRKTALALGIADELRTDTKFSKLQGREFLDKVAEEVERTLNPSLPTKVEGGGSGSRGGTNGKGYGDLPSEAKAVCERQAGRLVGKGRAFTTIQDWRNHYAQQYFAEE